MHEAEMMGGMHAMHAVPGRTRHVPEERMGLQRTGVPSVALGGASESSQGIVQCHVGRRRQSRVNGVAFGDAVAECVGEQSAPQEPAFPAMVAQIETVNRAIERVREVPANLGERPFPDRGATGAESIDLRPDFIDGLEGEATTARGRLGHSRATL